eukprot:9653172-Alexandrium_andersonii.AAC.1
MVRSSAFPKRNSRTGARALSQRSGARELSQLSSQHGARELWWSRARELSTRNSPGAELGSSLRGALKLCPGALAADLSVSGVRELSRRAGLGRKAGAGLAQSPEAAAQWLRRP